MRRQLVQVEGFGRHQHPGATTQFALQRVEQRLSGRVDRCQHRARGVRGPNEVAPQVFWQRADELGNQLFAQGRHLPGELVAPQPREDVDRHMHRHAIIGGAGLESVGQRQRDIARFPGVRPIGIRAVLSVADVHEIDAAEGQ